jgi:hypothetical protein
MNYYLYFLAVSPRENRMRILSEDQKISRDAIPILFERGIIKNPVDNLWISMQFAVDNLWIKLWTSG